MTYYYKLPNCYKDNHINTIGIYSSLVSNLTGRTYDVIYLCKQMNHVSCFYIDGMLNFSYSRNNESPNILTIKLNNYNINKSFDINQYVPRKPPSTIQYFKLVSKDWPIIRTTNFDIFKLSFLHRSGIYVTLEGNQLKLCKIELNESGNNYQAIPIPIL